MLLQWATSCACYLMHTARNTKSTNYPFFERLVFPFLKEFGKFPDRRRFEDGVFFALYVQAWLGSYTPFAFFAPLPLKLRRNCRNLNRPRETNSTHALRVHFKILCEPRDSVQSFGALPCYRKWLTEWRYSTEGPTRLGGTDIEYKNSTKTRT